MVRHFEQNTTKKLFFEKNKINEYLSKSKQCHYKNILKIFRIMNKYNLEVEAYLIQKPYNTNHSTVNLTILTIK